MRTANSADKPHMPSAHTISRALRITATATFGAALLLLIALWQRSYRQYDTLFWPGAHRMSSVDGWLHVDEEFQINRTIKRRNHQIGSVRIFTLTGNVTPKGVGIAVPIWVLATIVAPFVLLPWMRWHYSLRTLVAVATLIAAGLGIISALKRLPGQ